MKWTSYAALFALLVFSGFHSSEIRKLKDGQLVLATSVRQMQKITYTMKMRAKCDKLFGEKNWTVTAGRLRLWKGTDWVDTGTMLDKDLWNDFDGANLTE